MNQADRLETVCQVALKKAFKPVVILVLGGTDEGKSYFLRKLYEKFIDLGKVVAYVDTDPGQQDISIPATIGCEVKGKGKTYRFYSFVGSISPVGMYCSSLLVAVGEVFNYLHGFSFLSPDFILVDTCGLVDYWAGYVLLKGYASILKPHITVIFGKKGFLGSSFILKEFAVWGDVFRFKPSPEVIVKTFEQRKLNRIKRYQLLLNQGEDIILAKRNLKLFPVVKNENFGKGVISARAFCDDQSLFEKNLLDVLLKDKVVCLRYRNWVPYAIGVVVDETPDTILVKSFKTSFVFDKLDISFLQYGYAELETDAQILKSGGYSDNEQ